MGFEEIWLKYGHDMFGEGNAVEGFFSSLGRDEGTGSQGSFVSVQSWLDSFMLSIITY